MNNNDGSIIITENTNEDSRMYTHTFLFPTLSEQTRVKVESKRGVPKLKGKLKNHHTTIPMVSPFDPWYEGEEVDTIEKTSLTQSKNRFVPHIVN
jgi:hypothetical protein